MPKKIDPTAISVTRSRITRTVVLNFDDSGNLINLTADRWLITAAANGTYISAPVLLSNAPMFSFPASMLTNGQINQISAILPAIDTMDTGS